MGGWWARARSIEHTMTMTMMTTRKTRVLPQPAVGRMMLVAVRPKKLACAAWLTGDGGDMCVTVAMVRARVRSAD